MHVSPSTYNMKSREEYTERILIELRHDPDARMAEPPPDKGRHAPRKVKAQEFIDEDE